MPVDAILVPHDDGSWRIATLLGQHRTRNGWYVTARSYVGTGLQHQRWLRAEDWTSR